MEIDPTRRNVCAITDIVLFSTLIFSPHNSQRIDANTDVTNNITTTMTTHYITWDGALVAYLRNCFAQEILHHHGSQLLAAMVDRRPSFSQSWSRNLPRFHRCSKEWRQFTPALTRRAMPAPVWEGIATQLTLLDHPHMAAFILILLVTYMRPSELLALRRILSHRWCHFSRVGPS